MKRKIIFLGTCFILLLTGCGQSTFNAFDRWHITDPTERGLMAIAFAIGVHAILTMK